MSIKFIKADLNILNMKARMPFKYGIATLTALPHLFIRLKVQIDGKESIGLASEGLAPKWFTKNPTSSFEDDINEMFTVIQKALSIAEEIHEEKDVFSFWNKLYGLQSDWAKSTKTPSLLSSLGTSLLERALISAYCNAKETPFHQVVKDGSLGFNIKEIYPELDNDLLKKALPNKPADLIQVRHTVGLADPLTDDEIEQAERVHDGLPQSFPENIESYGISKLKIKLSGNVQKDSLRLSKIHDIMKKQNRDFSFTLDGNEFFKSAIDFKEYWLELSSLEALIEFLTNLLFIEQPIHRDFALNVESGDCFLNWNNRPKIIIDESDGDLTSAQKALSLGYSGTSHKNCKGIFKSIANACLMYAKDGILSAEDLCNIGPVALQEDLAVVATLGIKHVERNGHQYMAGLSMFPEDIQKQTISSNADLYKLHNGYPSLKISKGLINIKSVNDAPFGLDKIIETRNFTPLEKWNFSSLSFF